MAPEPAPLPQDVIEQLVGRAAMMQVLGDWSEFRLIKNILARHGHFDAVDLLARKAAAVGATA